MVQRNYTIKYISIPCNPKSDHPNLNWAQTVYLKLIPPPLSQTDPTATVSN